MQRSNRLLFVNSFIRHALHLSAAASVADFKEGLELLFNGPAVMMCSTGEVGIHARIASSQSVTGSAYLTWSGVAVIDSWNTSSAGRRR